MKAYSSSVVYSLGIPPAQANPTADATEFDKEFLLIYQKLLKSLQQGRVGLRTFLGAAALTLAVVNVGCGGGGGGGNVNNSNGNNSGNPSSGIGSGTRLVDQNGWNVNVQTYEQPKKKWTFLVYMNGANDLETFGVLNMNQMEQIGSNGDVNMVVQFKRIHQRSSDDTTNGDWNDTRRFYVTRDSDTNTIGSQLLSRRADTDMGKPATMQEFVQWGIKTFPAEHYCLVVWNHGAGWRTAKTKSGPVTRGVSYDDETGHNINTIEIPAAINMGNGRKWDILAFDSSLMQMLEVAYEVRNQATYIVGSEESPPGQGYPYHRFMGNLVSRIANGQDPTPLEFASDIAQQTINSYGADSDITHSVLDASKVAAIVPTVNNLGAVLLSKQAQYRDQIRQARMNAERYAAKSYYSYYEYRDLRDFTDLLTGPATNVTQPINDPEVQAATSAVQAALSAAVLKNVNGNQHPNSHGLSIFLTDPYTYNAIDILQANGFGQRYTALAFAKDAPNWVNFLKNGPQ